MQPMVGAAHAKWQTLSTEPQASQRLLQSNGCSKGVPVQLHLGIRAEVELREQQVRGPWAISASNDSSPRVQVLVKGPARDGSQCTLLTITPDDRSSWGAWR